MKTLTLRLEICVRRILALGLLAVLAGCGPGTGGTGTGPEAQTLTFGAEPTAGSPPASVGGAPAATPPSVPPADCGAACAGISLRLEPLQVEASAPCLRFASAGAWQVDASGLAVLDGQLQRGAGATATTQAARLRLQFTDVPERSRQVTLTLLDERGQVLLGPVLLQPVQVAPAAAACPAG